MSFHFNDPNFDSRNFNPVRPKLAAGMSMEEHLRIVKAGLKMIGVKEQVVPDLTRLFTEAKSRIKNIRDYAALVEGEHRMAGKDVDRKLFADEILSKYLDSFSHYNKDELLVILVQFLGEATVKELL